MNIRYIVGDTETSGLGDSAGVCEIAWAEIDEACNVLDIQHSLIDPQQDICPAASGIHHITNNMVQDAPTLEEFFTVVHDQPLARGEVVFIAHNAPFDIRFFKPWIASLKDVGCTLRLARTLLPDAPNHKLDTLRYLCDLPQGDNHRADSDVLATVELLRVFCYMTGMSVGDLVALSKQPIKVKRMGFGKHRGMEIKELAMQEPSYIRWLLNKADNVDDDLRYTLQLAITGDL